MLEKLLVIFLFQWAVWEEKHQRAEKNLKAPSPNFTEGKQAEETIFSDIKSINNHFYEFNYNGKITKEKNCSYCEVVKSFLICEIRFK